MGQLAQLPIHPLDSGISPWSGGRLFSDSTWEYHGGGKCSLICTVDTSGIIILRSFGWNSTADYDALEQIFTAICTKMQWSGRAWVLLYDCSALLGMDIAARGRMLAVLFAQKDLSGVVFSSPSPLVTSLVQLSVKFYEPNFQVALCASWEASCASVSAWLELPFPAVTTDLQSAKESSFNKDIDVLLTILSEVEWNKPGVAHLEAAAGNPFWQPFLNMMVIIKSDIDTMLVKRDERVAELQQSNLLEAALQQKMKKAFDESQKARIIFDQEAAKNLSLTQTLIETQRETLFSLSEIIESRSKETANHIRRVAKYSALLARLYGMDERLQAQILHASPMHDAGKIAIPDIILNKPGKLTEDEFSIMQDHARLGWEMLRSSNREILQHAATIAYQHHEKWNGKGYPNGLAGEEIHIFGRMAAVADVFDALGSARCYKDAWPLDRVFDLLRGERGEHFDPMLIDLFFENRGDFLLIRERFPDASS